MRISIVMLAIAVALAITQSILTDHATASSKIVVQAHRGLMSDYPENTLLAFDKAIEAGANQLEMDVAITEDDHVVIMHDATVNRTTNGSGRPQSFTLEELKQLDAGSWKGAEFAGNRIPTLEEVLHLIQGHDVRLNLELKTSSRTSSLVARAIKRTVETVKEHDAEDDVIFSSFDFQALQEVRKHLPEAKVLLIDWSGPSPGFDGIDLAINQRFWGWSSKLPFLTEERVKKANEAGLYVQMGIGASLSPRIPEWISWGVNGFSTDRTDDLVHFLEKEGLR